MFTFNSKTDQTPSSILVVDDNPGVLYSTSKILTNHQYEVATAKNAEEALTKVKARYFDLIVCDINMPGRSGLEFLNDLKRLDPTIASMVLTANGTVSMAIEAMKSGALGFVTKPFREAELIESVEAALEQARRVRESLQMEFYTPMLESLCNALLNTMEAGDSSNEGSSQRVARHSQAIATAIGLPAEDVSQIYLAGLFHDIGKIGVPDYIVKKAGPLDAAEQREMAQHPVLGSRIVEQAHGMSRAAKIILHHHERYDGTGYPEGLAGENIPLGSRIVAVADVYEELLTNRVYAPGRTHDEALEELQKSRGTQFDPFIIDIALQVLIPEPEQIGAKPGLL